LGVADHRRVLRRGHVCELQIDRSYGHRASAFGFKGAAP
jgi:hypothetical protein